MKAIFNNICKIVNYKPIYTKNGKWYVCFEYNEIKVEADPVLKNGRFVKSNELKSTGMCSYSYIVYSSKPDVATIKNDIEEIINYNVSNKITKCFKWNGINVNLSLENQTNYKASYDLAIQTGGLNLPIRIKGIKNGKTEYLLFFTVADFTEFYMALNKFINKCLNDGWDKKDSIDYNAYSA